MKINNKLVLRLRMIVMLPGEPPYSVVHKEIVPKTKLAQVQPGATFTVRVALQDHRQMTLVW